MKGILKLVAGILFFVLLVIGVIRALETIQEKRQRQKEAARQELINSALGYPAGEEHLRDDSVYYSNGFIVDQWQDETNISVILQPVKIVSSASYIHSKSNRLFRLSRPLEKGYWRVSRRGTNVSFEAIPGPVR